MTTSFKALRWACGQGQDGKPGPIRALLEDTQRSVLESEKRMATAHEASEARMVKAHAEIWKLLRGVQLAQPQVLTLGDQGYVGFQQVRAAYNIPPGALITINCKKQITEYCIAKRVVIVSQMEGNRRQHYWPRDVVKQWWADEGKDLVDRYIQSTARKTRVGLSVV